MSIPIVDKVAQLIAIAVSKGKDDQEARTAAHVAVSKIVEHKIVLLSAEDFAILKNAAERRSEQRVHVSSTGGSGGAGGAGGRGGAGGVGFGSMDDFVDFFRRAGFDGVRPPDDVERRRTANAREDQARAAQRAEQDRLDAERRAEARKRHEEEMGKQRAREQTPLPPGGCYATRTNANEPGRDRCSVCGAHIDVGERFYFGPNAGVWCVRHPQVASAWYPPMYGRWVLMTAPWRCSVPGCEDPAGQYLRGEWAYGEFDEQGRAPAYCCELCIHHPKEWQPRAAGGAR